MISGTPQKGRYPNVDGILPKQGPLLSVRVDPALLGELLQALAALGLEAVSLLYYGKDMPLGLIGHNAEADYFVDGMFMPLT